MAERHPIAWSKTPIQYRGDLHGNADAGLNRGVAGSHPETDAPTAYDLKGPHLRLQDLPDDDLKQIPVLPQGSTLEQGATYIDLHQPDPGEFTATADMTAGPNNWFVPKDAVPYPLWNRLRASWTNNG